MRVQRGFAWVLWFVAFFWLWMLLVGDWNPIEWIAGGIVAAVAATIAEFIRRLTRTRLLVPFDVLRQSALVFPMVFVDFGILVFALARSLATGRFVHGRYVTRAIDPGPKTTPAGAARRAWIVLLAGYSPNAYVVDIDVENETVLLHDLVPYRRSEEPA
jgi:multisubunit Na+/H+ antiporter MnhE subunit